MTEIEKLTERLKNGWISNWMAQQYLKSSSGDRILRFIRERCENGLIIGYQWEQRPKYCEKKGVLEYRLVKID